MEQLSQAASFGRQNEQQVYKVIILGDIGVGKTSLAVRGQDDRFESSYKSTIGVDFFTQEIQLNDRCQVGLQVWDIGGQTLHSRMVANYVYGCHCAVLVYDATNIETFKSLHQWGELLFDVCQQQPPHIALCANKIDKLTSGKQPNFVPYSQHQQFAKDNGFLSYLVSAKTGENVKSMFVDVASRMAGVKAGKVKSEVEQMGAIEEIDVQITDDSIELEVVDNNPSQNKHNKFNSCIEFTKNVFCCGRGAMQQDVKVLNTREQQTLQLQPADMYNNNDHFPFEKRKN